jgi:hypothetical protein
MAVVGVLSFAIFMTSLDVFVPSSEHDIVAVESIRRQRQARRHGVRRTCLFIPLRADNVQAKDHQGAARFASRR